MQIFVYAITAHTGYLVLAVFAVEVSNMLTHDCPSQDLTLSAASPMAWSTHTIQQHTA